MKNKNCDISFYKLTTLPIHKAAPKLIEKIYYSKQNLVVVLESEDLLKSVDDSLWSYSTKHFIPHGTHLDNLKEQQPIYFTLELENPNNSELIMALGAIDLDKIEANKYLYMFDGNNKNQLDFARNKWKFYQKQNHSLTYWSQNIDGSWEKQA